jgi:hypothetical protein
MPNTFNIGVTMTPPTMPKTYIRAKQWVPQISFLYCNAWGHILENQTQPTDGPIEDNLTSEESIQYVREYRNKLLADCDWTQLDDVPLSLEKVADWKIYRQALRDFPETINVDAWTAPDWPVPPS